jgi:predicted component of type VI protein secretion system
MRSHPHISSEFFGWSVPGRPRLPEEVGYSPSVAELVLHVVESPHEGESEIALTGQRAVEIGRAGGLDLTLTDAHVSERHARIVSTAGEFVVEDLGSENGTYVNEQPIQAPRVLLPGDRIRVGLTVLELQPAGATPIRPQAPELPDADHVLQHVPEEALSTPDPDPDAPPPFLVAEQPAAFVPQAVADETIDRPDSPLLRAWRDTHVKVQTEVAAFALLAVAGLGVGVWLGFH